MSDPILETLNRSAEEITPEDIDVIIAYMRKQRANFEAGVKPKKADDVDVVASLGIKKEIKNLDRRF
jgi:hypothetical protein